MLLKLKKENFRVARAQKLRRTLKKIQFNVWEYTLARDADEQVASRYSVL